MRDSVGELKKVWDRRSRRFVYCPPLPAPRSGLSQRFVYEPSTAGLAKLDLDVRRVARAQPPRPTYRCRQCNRKAKHRVLRIEPGRLLFVFECKCGHRHNPATIERHDAAVAKARSESRTELLLGVDL